MSTSTEFLLPKFGHEHFRIGVPTRVGEIRAVSMSDLFVRESRLFDVLDPRFRGIAREAKPTLWAQAETFHETVAAQVARQPPDTSADEFQVWAGLLAAVFRGDLVLERIGREALLALDEDLYPALKASLPIQPDPASWPPVLHALHHDAGLTVIRAGAGGAVVGGCYAPCLVFPALQLPSVAENPRLQKFQIGSANVPDLRFAGLMRAYGEQPGFARAFDAALGELADQLSATDRKGLFSDLARAISLLRQLVQAGLSREPAGKPAWRKDEGSFLGWCYDNPLGEEILAAGAGNVGYWRVFPLKVEESGRTVLIIPEGIDVTLNPWAVAPAFPGSPDAHTRLCDLSIHANADRGTTEVWGKEGRVYEVPRSFHLLSLHPQAPPPLRVVLDSLFYLEGSNNAVDPTLLHEIHGEWRRAMTSRDDVTPLIPLHTNLLKLFPGSIVAPKPLVGLAAGSVGDATAAEAICRLRLPLAADSSGDGALTFSWRARLIGWKLDETSLPPADVWPAFRGPAAPAWTAYFVRTKSSTGKLNLFFHGEAAIRERPAAVTATAASPVADSLYKIERLTSPPRLAEVVSNANPQQGPLGLLFLSGAIYASTDTAEKIQVAIDFGTSNTSVAIQRGEATMPEALEMGPWAAPLLYPISSRLTPPQPHPGWFLQGARADCYHRGFFPTLLGYKKALAFDRRLLGELANPVNQTSDAFGDLVGAFDLLGIKGDLALMIDRSAKVLGPIWGIEDNLKWPSPGENPEEKEVRRKAFRTAFLELLLLHVCAEAYAKTSSLPARYTFTYPLSMRRSEVDLYQASALRAVAVVEGLASAAAASPQGPAVNLVNESQAVFKAYLRSHGTDKLRHNQRVVLIDMGGGSADYAVFAGSAERTSGHGNSSVNQLCFLDSMVLAGNRFFEFIQDIATAGEYSVFERSLKGIFKDQIALPDLAGLRDESRLRLLRQFYTLRVGSMMPDKSPFFYQARDIESLEQKERALAEELDNKVDHYPAGHWMRALFKTVLVHGLLLGVAPLPHQVSPESVQVVLAGNGWGLLHHAGVIRDTASINAMVLAIYKQLKAFLDHYRKAGSTSALPEASRVKTSLMEDVVKDILAGRGVFSKDAVAAGGILEGPTADHVTAHGIVGFDLPVIAALNREGSSNGQDAPMVLPWNLSVAKPEIDAFLKDEIDRRAATGAERSPFESQRVLSPSPDRSLEQPLAGPKSVPEQLLALQLLKTGGFGGQPTGMLDIDQWEEWNAVLYEQAEVALANYGDARSGQPPEATSLIRVIWEYPLVNRQVRRSLFQRMNGGS